MSFHHKMRLSAIVSNLPPFHPISSQL